MTGRTGFALVELLVAIFIVALLSVATFNLATLGIRTAIVTEYRSVAQGIATSEIERINHLSYLDVVLADGSVPDGLLTPTSQIAQNGQTYDIVRAVTLIDDPQNGKLSDPIDESNADYKKVTITVTPPNEPDQNVTFTTLVVRQVPPVDLPDPVAYWSFSTGSESCPQRRGFTYDDVGALDGVIVRGDEANNAVTCGSWQSPGPTNLGSPNQFFQYANGSWSRFRGVFDAKTPPISFTSSFSIATWVSPNLSPSNTQNGLVSYNNNIWGERGSTFEWYLTAAGGLELLLTNNELACGDINARQVFADPDRIVTARTWQHVGIVYDSTNNTVQHYIDGVPGTSLSVRFKVKNCGEPGFFAIGSLVDVGKSGFNPTFASPRGSAYYQGGMDDLRIYDSALEDDQIRFLSQGNS